MKKILFILFTITISLSGCSERIEIRNTKWQSIDNLDFIEFKDSLCLFIKTSRNTSNKDSILAKFSYTKDTITLEPLQEHIIFNARFLATDSGLVNLKRNIVVARKIE